MTLLQLKDVYVSYHIGTRASTAVEQVSLKLDEQDSIGIVGESGSGKTTLAMAVLRLLPQKSTQVEGDIRFQGMDLLRMSEEQLARIRWKEIAVVPQQSMNVLSPVHRIGWQMSDILRQHEPGLSQKQLKANIMDLLSLVRLSSSVYYQYPYELSGGMLQRVSIALGLMHRPKLLIMDEATTALDAITQEYILQMLLQMERAHGISRMMITHDMSVVATSCNNIAVMYAGRLVEYGSVTEVLQRPLHPYTQDLINSLVFAHGIDEECTPRTMHGAMPEILTDMDSSPRGCVYAGRCSYVTSTCLEYQPKDQWYSSTRRVACHGV
ncbi:ABC transporter ATP-binding protein [Paenibacillus massiliensis]|uniref:ABC transporter ATP-binding protein n=1 Tax=Paenibacillus massiliensis TaxID=225917 RepID=UPI00047297AF|nr:ABC transporter ATP-binding protein [Paenibacillus massiliensis]